MESLGVGAQSEAAYLHTDGLFARAVSLVCRADREAIERLIRLTERQSVDGWRLTRGLCSVVFLEIVCSNYAAFY